MCFLTQHTLNTHAPTRVTQHTAQMTSPDQWPPRVLVPVVYTRIIRMYVCIYILRPN